MRIMYTVAKQNLQIRIIVYLRILPLNNKEVFKSYLPKLLSLNTDPIIISAIIVQKE